MAPTTNNTLAAALKAIETPRAPKAQAERLTYAEARAELDARMRAGQPVSLFNNKGDVIGEARIATFGGAAPLLMAAE